MADPIYALTTDLPNFGLPVALLSQIPAATQSAQLSAASRVMDGYFRSRMDLPLLSWGDDVRECCCVIASYKCMLIRGFNPEAPGDRMLAERYRDVVDWLTLIANGRAMPSVTDSSSGATEGYTSEGPTMTSAVQRGFSSRDTQPDGSEPGDFVGG